MGELRGTRVVLRPMHAGDRPLLSHWLRDRELRRSTGRRVPLGSRSQTADECRDRQFLVLLREDGRPIGVCGLFGIDPVQETAEVGILLGEKDTWGHGYGPEALRLLLNHAYEAWGLRQISLSVHAANARAIRAYEKVGFRIEERLTVGRWLFGQGVEVLIMALPASEGAMRQEGRR